MALTFSFCKPADAAAETAQINFCSFRAPVDAPIKKLRVDLGGVGVASGLSDRVITLLRNHVPGGTETVEEIELACNPSYDDVCWTNIVECCGLSFPNVCLVGAGIANMYLAREILLKRPSWSVVLLEKGPAPGGRIKVSNWHGVSLVEGAGVGRHKDRLLRTLLTDLEIPHVIMKKQVHRLHTHEG